MRRVELIWFGSPHLIARGSIISMLAVILILPAIISLFDKLICATSAGFGNKNETEVIINEIIN